MPETLPTIARRQAEAGSKDKVIAALGKSASQLRKQLGESLSSLEKYDAPLDRATTSSLEALQAYRTGQTLYRSGKRHESVAFFERAVELDPQFCSAYSMLGSAYHSLGDEQTSRENLARAFELKDRRLTQEENFQTTVLYYSSITGNREKETAELVCSIRRIHGARPPTTCWGSPMPNRAGRKKPCRSSVGLLTILRYPQLRPIAFIENDSATMERLARETPPDDISWGHLQMELAFFRGDFSKLRSLSETQVKQQSHSSRMENVAYEFAFHGVHESDIGNYALARDPCRQAEDVGNDSAAGLSVCAKALADAGELPQAEAVAAKLDRLFPEDTFHQKVYLPLIYSIIERKRGNTTKAVDLLAPITQYPDLVLFYYRAQAYLDAGEHAKAVDQFQSVIARRGSPEWGIRAPLSQLGLARTYAAQGNLENSRKAYDDFFTTWKDADPDIPILRQAKAEYKKLTATASAADLVSRKL